MIEKDKAHHSFLNISEQKKNTEGVHKAIMIKVEAIVHLYISLMSYIN